MPFKGYVTYFYFPQQSTEHFYLALWVFMKFLSFLVFIAKRTAPMTYCLPSVPYTLLNARQGGK